MINLNKKWLLTASPWMRLSLRITPLLVAGVLSLVLLVLGVSVNARPLPPIPVVTGNTNICIGTHTTLNGTPAGGTWSSSNTAVATVNSSTGDVLGVAGGVANVTYTVGGSSFPVLVTVTYPIAGPSSVCTGNMIKLTDSTPTGLWSSSSNTTAAVDVTGTITGISAGTVTITFGRAGACVVTKSVTVVANTLPPINGVGVISVCVGGTTTLTDGSTGGTWASSTPSVATIVSSTGLATGVSAGASTITYTNGGCNVTKSLMVSATSAINPIAGSGTVCIGNVAAMTNTTLGGTWSSSNTAVATVNSGGGVTGISAGSATITYSKNGCFVTKVLTIVANTTAAITGNSSVCIGTPATLSDATSGGIWTSGSVTVAIVGSLTGTVTGVAAGSSTITYSVTGGCYQTLFVNVNPASSVGAINGVSALCKNSTATLTDVVPGGTWSSSNTALATINAYGLLTGVGAGSVNIIYTRLGCTSTKAITVNDLPGAIGGTFTVCAGSATTLTDATGGGKWKSSNTVIATIDSSAGTLTGIAAGSAIITYTSGAGCYVTKQVTVNGPAPISGGSTACVALASYLYLYDPTPGGTWSSGNTTIAAVGAATGVVTGNASGTVNISYTVAGCIAVKNITVNYAPGLITGNFVTCVGAVTSLTDTAAGGAWVSSNTNIATIDASGNVYGVATGGTLISYIKNGCTRTASISVGATLAPINGPASVCAGLATIQLVDTPTTGGSWSANNTLVSVNSTGVVTGVSAGASIVSYSKNGCTVTKSVTVNTNTVSTVAGIPYVCTGQTNATLYDGTVGGVWTVRDPFATINSTTGAVTGVSGGSTVITYTQPSTGCFKTTVFAVQATPDTIVGPYSVCVANSITLTNTVSGGGWTSSNTAVATIPAPGVVMGVTAGAVTITYSKNGCAVYQPVIVKPNVVAAIGGTTAVCTTLTTTLTDATTGGVWSTSDVTLATVGATGIVTGVAAGTPSIFYTMAATGCYAGATVTVNATYPAAIAGNTTVCLADTIMLTDATAGGTWKASNTKASIASTGVVTGSAAATGVDTITYTFIGCPVTQTITVNPNPVGAITGTLSLCANGSTTLADTTAGGTWTSSSAYLATVSSGGVVSGVALGNPSITYTNSTGCYRAAVLTVNAVPAPITGNTPVCMNATNILSDATGGGVYSSSNAAIANIVFTNQVYGVAAGTATITYTWNGCSVTSVATVNALPPAITPTAATKICHPGTASLSDATSGGTWSSSDVTLATVSSSGVVTSVAAGSPVISYTEPTNGCVITKSISIGVPPTPIYGSHVVCTNNYNFLYDTTLGGTWTISDASKATITSYSVPAEMITAIALGTTTVTYTTPGCTPVVYPMSVNATPKMMIGVFSACTDSVQLLVDSTRFGVWSSSDVTIATVLTLDSIRGKVTGAGSGLCVITYTDTILGCALSQPFDVSNCGHKESSPNSTLEIGNEKQVYTLYPNPSNGNITIMQSIVEDAELGLTVINYVGATIYNGNIQFAGGKGRLNLSNAVPGMYMVVLRNNKGDAQTFKVIIE